MEGKIVLNEGNKGSCHREGGLYVRELEYMQRDGMAKDCMKGHEKSWIALKIKQGNESKVYTMH